MFFLRQFNLSFFVNLKGKRINRSFRKPVYFLGFETSAKGMPEIFVKK